MNAKYLVTSLAAAALLSTSALAQAPAPAQSSSTPRADVSATATENQSSNEWRASKVIGLYVYNDANERLGSINELLTDSTGKVVKAVIGVGGFLGIGESDVAVNFDQLKFVNEPMRTAATTNTAPATTTTTPPAGGTASSGGMTGSGTVGTTSTTTTTTTTAKPTINPDHAKLSATKDQLKAMPQFKYAN